MSRPAPNPPKEHAMPRIKLPDFEALRAERDAALRKVAQEIHAEFFADKPIEDMQVHISGARGCYCACPDGPCEHQFSGCREFDDGLGFEQVCQRGGTGAMSHSLRCGP
jgi:hypothetical protein